MAAELPPTAFYDLLPRHFPANRSDSRRRRGPV